ncbi:diguanylate cyclase [Marinobacter sp. EVN1]|uniref:GGDEF domain-containing protein n=1 Tax=unclassified Marinobacter TaxID=83889 RepID=UPI0003B9142F|nr:MULTISPECIES: GGDEF domain-containing protein [unclassified Marinobacter]ERS86413.1 diguanylate cyclase [Marinobacter sp. EVN1]ERS87209.1 diguanylate cyclase [Marinobacter sp. C1S70]
MASEDSWKEKYLRELEEAEHREKQWESERNLLERMLVRTSLASEGQRPELDELLGRLREDIRKKQINLQHWRELQDQIDRQITLLDEQAGPQTALPTPEPKATDDHVDLADTTQRLRIARRIGQLLGQLLQQASLEPPAEAEARELQQTLLTSNDWEVLREGLNRVADLVIAAITRSQREFEAFLKRLDERLQALREHFAQQSDVQTCRQDATAMLDREIRAELDRVADDIRASHDIQALKQSVSQRLEFIGSALERFRTSESEREKLLANQLEAMQEKVAAMEAHSEQMQAQVREERQRALTDLLTQLPNREAWQERLSFEYNRWLRYRHPLTVAVLDVDLFKRINDSYGHKAGDRVLQLVAREMSTRLRSTDFIARFGGEEFVVLLPETPTDEARKVLDSLREHVSGLPFHFSGEPVSITFSAGLTGFQDDDTEESVFDRADRALYQAKDEGRNRVSVL